VKSLGYWRAELWRNSSPELYSDVTASSSKLGARVRRRPNTNGEKAEVLILSWRRIDSYYLLLLSILETLILLPCH
jgi:hypothetical protein